MEYSNCSSKIGTQVHYEMQVRSHASDSSLRPTAGLIVDEQHDHIWDTCVPTFLHYNIPLMIFGTVAAVLL